MLAGMSSAMLSEWMAFAAVEPFGEERNDYRLAYALAVIVNLFRDKDTPPVQPKDLMPSVGILEAYVPEPYGAPAQPPKHPNVAAFEEAMRVAQWAQ